MAALHTEIDAFKTRDIDLVHLARQTAGDRLLEREVLGLFRDQCARLLAAMAAAGQGRARRDAAHTLTGAARAVGAFRVAELARFAESSSEERFADAVGALAAAVNDARALIDRLLASR